MPRGDGTGPMGMGPMTGRAAGTCAGFETQGVASSTPGRGRGMGFRRGQGFGGRGSGGHGWRNMFRATGLPGWMRFGRYAAPYGDPTSYQKPDPEIEKQALQNQAEALQSDLDLVRKRLSEIEPEATTE
ncbi:MAG: DUF5320 domain-containing protein [Candidatus Sumerlaeota bacterium]|nr:DUF5320 domain-containing protein [Candidatus Sumerlaeota bacterium]